MKDGGLAAWGLGDNSAMEKLGGAGIWGGPWNNPNLSKEEREKMVKEWGAGMGSMGGMGPWGGMGVMGPWGGMGGMGPWNNPNLSKEDREKMMKSGMGGMMGGMGGMMGGMGPWNNPNLSKEDRDKMMKDGMGGMMGGMGGPWGGMGMMGGMGPWGGMMGGMGGPWNNPNLSKEDREKMMKSGMGGMMGGMGPWGGMMGGMGPWGGMMGGMGPWNNPNMTPEEREKMMKSGMGGMMGGMGGPWGGMGGMAPWNNPNMSKEDREKMMKDGGQWAGAMMGPWASGIPTSKEGQKNFWNLGNATAGVSSPPMTPDQTPRTTKVRPTKPHDVTNEALERAKAQQGTAGFIDTATKCELVSHLAGTIGDHSTLESKRRDIAMRSDFCLSEIFNMIDTHKVGYVSLSDLEDFAKSGNINLEREDWAVLLDRYDSDADGYLNFNEFSSLFLPTLKEYRSTMVGRQPKGTQTFLKLTLQTKRIVRDLLYSLLTCEENFEYFKHKMTGNSIAVANEIFDFLDRNKDGYITLNEFTASLLDAGLSGKKGEFGRLFKMFDAKNTGKIGFSDFHNPGKTADVEALNVLEDS